MNRETHQHIAPNDSFIAASDFKSPKELANFLKQLASNKEEYIKFSFFDNLHSNILSPMAMHLLSWKQT
uniref:Fucosyltransferase n=1 Tax=Acrobeloides nanus TaxID=290746 RepID=A0A914CR97_9BILA